MFNIKFTSNVNQLTKAFTVYQIHDRKTLDVIFVGFEKMVNMGRLTEFFHNEILKEYVDDPQREFFVSMEIVPDKTSAMKRQSDLLREANFPVANRYSKVSRQGVIYCHETGQEFSTMTDAANMMGLSQSNLSKHLRNMPGYRTVKGYTFSRKNNLTKM